MHFDNFSFTNRPWALAGVTNIHKNVAGVQEAHGNYLRFLRKRNKNKENLLRLTCAVKHWLVCFSVSCVTLEAITR